MPQLPGVSPTIAAAITDTAQVAAGAVVSAGRAMSAAIIDDLVSPRTLQARFDLDDVELDQVCAALRPVCVGPMRLTRYRTSDVTALLTVAP